MIFILLGIMAIHYLIAYYVCIYFSKSYPKYLNKLRKFLVVVLSGPITLASILAIIFATPLRNTDAGLFDGGGALVVLMSLFIFPAVSSLLVKLFMSKSWASNNA